MSDQAEPRSFILTEEELAAMQQHALDLLDPYPPTDPRSSRYRRHLNRPRIRWRLLLLLAAGFFCVPAGVFLLCGIPGIGGFPRFLCAAASALLYLFLLRRPVARGLIRLYQRYAPDRVRSSCVFEPSCSEYMLQAIDKYGTLRGIRRGFARLKRCNPQGGGFDPV